MEKKVEFKKNFTVSNWKNHSAHTTHNPANKRSLTKSSTAYDQKNFFFLIKPPRKDSRWPNYSWISQMGMQYLGKELKGLLFFSENAWGNKQNTLSLSFG